MKFRPGKGMLGHLSIGRFVLLTALGCGLLALGAPIAGASSGGTGTANALPGAPPYITFNDCTNVTYSYPDFPAGVVSVATETLSVNGTQVLSKTFTFTPTAAAQIVSDVVPITAGRNGATLVASITYSIPSRGVANKTVTSTPYTLASCPLASPAIATTVSPTTVDTGASFSDSAALSGGNSPTGTITFKLYAASDTTCSTPLSTSPPVTVTGNGTYTSPAVSESTAGSYVWVASYSGDASNHPVADPCGQAAETVLVVAPPPPAVIVTPVISTTASKGVVAGGKISDTATLSGTSTTAAATGTIKFALYSASDKTCSTPLATVTTTVNGNGPYTSPAVTKNVSGTFQWVASYSGDANDNPVAEPCNVAAEQVTVTPPPPHVCVAASASLSGVIGNRKGTFTAHLKGKGVTSVTFYLDGHKFATVKKAHNGSFSVTINAAAHSYGAHTVKAKTTVAKTYCHGTTVSATFVRPKPHPPYKPTG